MTTKETTTTAPKYTDYEWPEDNTGWFVGFTSLSGRWRRREFAAGATLALILLVLPLPLVRYIGLVASIAVSAKRLHDMNLTSKFVFLLVPFLYGMIPDFTAETTIDMIIPILPGLIVFCLLSLIPGSKGVNKYGSNPRRDYEEQCVELGYPKVSECK